MRIHVYAIALVSFPFSCMGQVSNNEKEIDNLNSIIDVNYPWLSLGVSIGRQYNYAHIQGHVPIPSSGISEFVAVPTTSFGLRIQREFDTNWLWRAGVDISEFGLRVSTTYQGGGRGRTGHFEQQTQVHFAVQHYPFRHSSKLTRPYLRLGVLANVNTGPPSKTLIRFSRQLSGSPTYYDYIEFEKALWLRPGIALGLGLSRRIWSGFMFDFAFVAYRGLFELTDIDYRVERDAGSGPPEELLKTKIINRGSFIGIEGNVYLPPFRFKKILRELRQIQ